MNCDVCGNPAELLVVFAYPDPATGQVAESSGYPYCRFHARDRNRRQAWTPNQIAQINPIN